MYSRFVWGFGAAHDLFSGSVLPGHEDGSEADDGHEDDQVVQFFEQDYELKQDTFRAVLTPEELEQIEQLKVPYMNCVAAVDHQNEQIIFLLQQLAEQKRQRDDARRTADAARVKELGVQIAQTKLDLSDRKTKRNLKNQERVNTHYTPLMQAINTARLKVFDFESQHAQQEMSGGGFGSGDTGLPTAPATEGGAIGEDGESVLESRASSSGLRHRRQRPRHVPDSVIAQALKAD